ncbi:MAG: glycine cleavage system aminomethyltransferase GcvT [Endomicrobium sp.]|jgi:aminomethyltransferase|nr:glycine cleavage system aminomethyltransferase GcvT [Endomicrobium sp.]
MKRTFLYDEHKKLNAKFTEFGGWEMPVYYSSIIDEHNAVRSNCGVFDVSHMGTFSVCGNGAQDFLNSITLGNISGLVQNKARYSMFLNEAGGIIDDIIVYRLKDEYMIVVNAGNLDKDWQWLSSHICGKAVLKDLSGEISLLAVQGPKSREILQTIVQTDLNQLKYFSVTDFKFTNINADFARIARTGYTGEDGFEIFISASSSCVLWETLISLGIKPCGLGCRDTLRLEACMPLHGHELSEDITPLEAGFQNTVNWNNDFIGKAALEAHKDSPLRKTIAFECLSGIARNGNPVYFNGQKSGYVTSGAFSPTLKKAVGMALVESETGAESLEVEIRNNKRKIQAVEKPFYKRQK